MDIAIDITPLQDGHRDRGIGTYTRGLLHGLAGLDSDDRYSLYYWKGLSLDAAGLEVPRDARWIGLGLPRAGRLSALLAQQVFMLPTLVRARPTVYHQLGLVANPLAGGIPWVLVDRCVPTIHDVMPLIYPSRYFRGKRLRRLTYSWMLRMARRAPAVLTDSQASKADLVRLVGVAPATVTVAPLAVAPAFVAALASPLSEPPEYLPDRYLLTVAGDYPNKNIRMLLAAYRQVAGEPDPPELVLVGPQGPALAEFTRQHPAVAQRVRVYPRLSLEQLAATYRRALAVVVPSEYEGFGLPVLEAMAAGVPVLAANTPALAELAGDAAWLTSIHDPRALAESISDLVHNAPERAKFRARGLDRVGGFSWSSTAEHTYRAYERVASRRANSA